MWWFTQGSCFLPFFLVVWSSTSFILSYLIALFRRDVDVLFPYISDAAANPPESCIFGLMTFVSACAGMATIYSRFKFVEKLSEETRVVNPQLNKTTLVLGILSCIGMCVVATFQETAVTAVHDVGALLFFVSGVLYILLQTVISYQAFPHESSITVCRVRLAVTVIASLAFFPTVICAFFVKQTDLHRVKDSKDYPFHVASAVCEWVVAFSFVCFFLTYIDDFKRFTLRVMTELG
ncbi:DNA damage-regulated autophagy modulator protein 1 isoform X1 [Corythoichthys intestinalis]|uniref:DNA damage-regulated autophagy modulator protein 1 isoform X1 n=1 Tax=Corythoichthys intestinalis TaxID=161448 RepID=UPI0025A634FC|nr:DNA damage-regulated autophagy modulator protein 1 isoform X1 [Corythoichthys intestinalis]